MSHDYKAITWTPFKKRFDLWLLAGIVFYIGAFFVASIIAPPPGEQFIPIQILIRATGTLAFLLLTFILTIGPLARLTDRMKPFLYNRRHLGVATFLIALVHAGLVTLWYHGFSDVNPLVSLFISNPLYTSIAGFPFEALGLGALLIMFLMAATSHDYWNANLAPGLWKAIHMAVYVAFALLIGHIALGVIQAERDPLYIICLIAAGGGVAGLHLFVDVANGKQKAAAADDGWLKSVRGDDIPNGQAYILSPIKGERIAIFRHGRLIFAVSNVCRHQGGPLGEGRIVDDCITCPWHGFQYRMEDGRSPAPFTEKISTYATRIVDGVVYVNPAANPPGTPQPPSELPGET